MQSQGPHPGIIKYVNSGAAISANAIVDLGGRVGVALVDIAATTGEGSFATFGNFFLPKDASTIANGDDVYWDVSESKVTTTQGDGDPRIGIATEAAATGAGYVYVELNANVGAGRVAIASGDGTLSGTVTAFRNLLEHLKDIGIIERGN